MILHADARHIPLASESVNCVVTSPPYWGLRDYGIEPSIWGGREDCAHEWGEESQHKKTGGTASALDYTINQFVVASAGSFCLLCSAWRGVLGLEPTPELYVTHMVEVFREVWRVLRKDGTCWVNLGDSYQASPAGNKVQTEFAKRGGQYRMDNYRADIKQDSGLKPKDLCGIPWRVAFALQADGWWLRSDIIWSKPNPMPESVTDRPTKAHEYIFLLTKSERYFFDQDAVREPGNGTPWHASTWQRAKIASVNDNRNDAFPVGEESAGRNIRSVWQMATEPFPEAHFATFPQQLAKRCILAGCPLDVCATCGAPWERVTEKEVHATGIGRNHIAGGDKTIGVGWEGVPRATIESRTLGFSPTCACKASSPRIAGSERKRGIVLDPFAGSGTTVKAAKDCGRVGIGLDLKPEYLRMAQRRTAQEGLGL